ncbi:Uncharacterized protein DAT39_020387 [Clarias magur]|uniref:Uncharacterized protein n=1 Tax=Clarias magur TaxID=1594786 RepID=A0A8J4X9T7_CLAMG|nr:Uncharacterized protein DAT39_020387 [Clarias magur]
METSSDLLSSLNFRGLSLALSLFPLSLHLISAPARPATDIITVSVSALGLAPRSLSSLFVSVFLSLSLFFSLSLSLPLYDDIVVSVSMMTLMTQ